MGTYPPESHSGFLSSGESNTIYLSVRLALSIFSQPFTRHCPLVLQAPSARIASLIAG
jgi:hypothetical protein